MEATGQEPCGGEWLLFQNLVSLDLHHFSGHHDIIGSTAKGFRSVAPEPDAVWKPSSANHQQWDLDRKLMFPSVLTCKMG